MSRVPPDRIHADVYEADGTTLIGWMKYINQVSWHEELSKPGWVSFQMPLNDPMTAHLQDRRIVKLSWIHRGYPVYQYACRLQGDVGSFVADGRRWLRFEQQPGLLGMLGDGCVLPEYGLKRRSASTRVFGFPSADGNWRLDGNWGNPVGYAMSAETGHRKGHPPELKRWDPDWIGYINPAAHVPPQYKNYFRETLTLTEGKYVQLVYAGDNTTTVYHQGEQIAAPDYSNPFGWRNAQMIPLRLPAGDHVFGFEVENAPLAYSDTLGNPIGLVYCLFEVNVKGEILGVLAQSQAGSTTCIVHDNTPPPGWHRAQVIRANVLENQAYGVDAIQKLTLGFTDFRDSYGNVWPQTELDTFEFDIATVNLADVVAQLTESHLDVWVRPSDLKLMAARRRGSDKSATVSITLGDGGPDTGNAIVFDSHRRPARFTHTLTQAANGSWVATTDATAQAAAGRIVAGLSLGSAGNDSSVSGLALKQLAEFSTPRVFIDTAKLSSNLSGAIAGKDFTVGDTVTAVGWRASGTIRARCLAIDLEQNGDAITTTPGFAEDTS